MTTFLTHNDLSNRSVRTVQIHPSPAATSCSVDSVTARYKFNTIYSVPLPYESDTLSLHWDSGYNVTFLTRRSFQNLFTLNSEPFLYRINEALSTAKITRYLRLSKTNYSSRFIKTEAFVFNNAFSLGCWLPWTIFQWALVEQLL